MTICTISGAGRRLLLALALIPSLMVCAQSGGKYPNLIPNPDFKDGLEHWQVAYPHPNESKYGNNHEYTKVVVPPGRATAKAIEFSLTSKVAASEGVKASSAMIPIERGMAYEFGADLYSEGPTTKIFVEGYREDPKQEEVGDNQYKGFVRVYRAVIHVEGATKRWSTQKRLFKPPATPRYQPTHVMVKMYAYWPGGKVYWTNVFLRRSDQEPAKEAGARINPSQTPKAAPK